MVESSHETLAGTYVVNVAIPCVDPTIPRSLSECRTQEFATVRNHGIEMVLLAVRVRRTPNRFDARAARTECDSHEFVRSSRNREDCTLVQTDRMNVEYARKSNHFAQRELVLIEKREKRICTICEGDVERFRILSQPASGDLRIT